MSHDYSIINQGQRAALDKAKAITNAQIQIALDLMKENSNKLAPACLPAVLQMVATNYCDIE